MYVYLRSVGAMCGGVCSQRKSRGCHLLRELANGEDRLDKW